MCSRLGWRLQWQQNNRREICPCHSRSSPFHPLTCQLHQVQHTRLAAAQADQTMDSHTTPNDSPPSASAAHLPGRPGAARWTGRPHLSGAPSAAHGSASCGRSWRLRRWRGCGSPLHRWETHVVIASRISGLGSETACHPAQPSHRHTNSTCVTPPAHNTGPTKTSQSHPTPTCQHRQHILHAAHGAPRQPRHPLLPRRQLARPHARHLQGGHVGKGCGWASPAARQQDNICPHTLFTWNS